MTDDEWERIEGRIASTWPAPASDAAAYRRALGDLDAAHVEAAIDAMLLEHRNAAPPPGALRDRAHEEAAYGGDPPAPIAHLPDDDDTPVPSRLSGRRESGRATAALVLAMAGLFVLPVVCSVLALRLGGQALDEIEADPDLGGADRARAARVLGWVGLVAFAVVLVVSLILVARA